MRKLFLDFDGTLVDSTKAMLQCYPMWDSSANPIQDFSINWNFKDAIPNVREDTVKSIFNSHTFFILLELFDGVYDTLKEISDLGVEIIIVSVGTPVNTELKRIFIKNNLPFCRFVPLAQEGELSFDKSIVNMANGVFIDDRTDCLQSSNATLKILYKHDGLEYQHSKGNAHHMVATGWDRCFKRTLISSLID